MRDGIALTAIGFLSALAILLGALAATPSRPHGKHSAPRMVVELSPGFCTNPWPSPEPDHVAARRALIIEEVTASPLSYRAERVTAHLDEATLELRLTRERRHAAALATMGIDYPYTYEGAPFGFEDFTDTAGVTA
ncbi:hypothetical protein AB0D11_25615 [Streptomyces monashensis]|uniref:hypothetical protein n=1 Tax=Streptomyces monashensis TaxID=1678012 RepID=UPI0033CD1967